MAEKKDGEKEVSGFGLEQESLDKVLHRQGSVSSSNQNVLGGIAPSAQVMTKQKSNRPLSEYLSHMTEMGFDTDIATVAYNQLLKENDGDYEAFTWEQCIAQIVANKGNINDNDDNGDNDNGDNDKNEDNGNNSENSYNSENEKVSMIKSKLDIENTGYFASYYNFSEKKQENEEMKSSNDTENDNGKEKEKEKTFEPRLTDEELNYIGNKLNCTICTLDRPEKYFHKASCNHNYCKDCLTHYYHSQISNGIVTFKCMDATCDRLIDENELYLFIDSKKNNSKQMAHLKSKYEKFRRNMELAQNPNVRWCVKPGCDTPIIVNDKKLIKKLENYISKEKGSRGSRSSSMKVSNDFKLQCPECHGFICFNCASEWHGNDEACDDVLDKKLDKWVKESDKDVQYCPKCNARIEKLEGCNHMTCSYCKYQFCWLCRKEYKKGHYNATNIFNGCPGAEHGNVKPNKCAACCNLCSACLLSCILPCRICCWKMKDQGLPWCLCWCCCN